MKNKRQEKILEILKEKSIFTQDDLQNALIDYGFSVTQSTVSRDIRELKLVKSHDKDGNYCYIAPKEQPGGIAGASAYSSMIVGAVKSVDYSLNNVVIKCYSGLAQGVGVAIDEMFKGKMLGTIAGDDTVLIITHSEEESKRLVYSIKEII